MSDEEKNSTIWNEYYKSSQGFEVGNLYPNEPLVRILSKISSGVKISAEQYFKNEGAENDERKNLGGG